MTQIANYINSYSDNTAYSADQSKDYPNISYIQGTDEVKYATDPRVVCVYNITDTSAATSLLYFTRNLSDMIIDGVMQPSVVTSYQFSTTGEHIVKFGLTDNTSLRENLQGKASLVSVTIPNSVTSIGNNAFNSCNGLTSVTIPNTVTSIGNYVFSGCSNLTSVTMSNSLTSIGDDAFQTCTKLTSIDIPNSVTTIGVNAFLQCTGATSVTIGSGVSTIGNNAFNRNGAIMVNVTYTVLPTTPPTMGTNVFRDYKLTAIYVPAESVETYKAASGWSTYASRIQAIPTT